MVITGKIEKIRSLIKKAGRAGKSVGLVPTMGAIHEGHLSLVRKARRQCDIVVVSIFVNPLQFSPAEDFSRYPRAFRQDKKILLAEGVNILFNPTPKAIYGAAFSTHVEESVLSRHLCGNKRPGHFRGVCTVVVKLFNIVKPDIVYFGQKDYQQAQIVKKMINDLNLDVKFMMLPIVREKDKLAMSSRNRYLAPEQRIKSRCLYEALMIAQDSIKNGQQDSKVIISRMRRYLRLKGARIDYVEICDPGSLDPVKKIRGKILIGLAVYIGRTRLIDNLLIYDKKR